MPRLPAIPDARHAASAAGDQLTAAEVRAHINLIQQVMRTVMKAGTHYDKIPGTDKPSLLKPGSEVLLTTFRISVDPQIEDLSTPDCVRYRVRAVGTHYPTGTVIGVGVGECSSAEEKYKWRAAATHAEYERAPEDRRRIKYGWRWGKARGEKVEYEIEQVRIEPADVANTVLKMAKKRAQIDLTLTAMGASDIFTQDIEDMPPEILRQAPESHDEGGESRDPKTRPVSTEPLPEARGRGHITGGQMKMLRYKAAAFNIEEKRLLEQFQTESLADLTSQQYREAMDWIGAQPKPGNAA